MIRCRCKAGFSNHKSSESGMPATLAPRLAVATSQSDREGVGFHALDERGVDR